MTKRRFRDSADVPFGEERPGVGDSWIQADSDIFGAIAAVDAQNERIKGVSIFDITPDPAQPRRAVPSTVRAQWNGNPATVADMFTAWWDLTQQERGEKPFPLEGYLMEVDEAERSNQPGPIEASFLQVIDLAVSIRRDGLTNPVTVAPVNGRYQLETGERRWLAYHLLYAFFDGQQPERPDEREIWGKIPARQMNQVDVWRQATENNARADLNAIGKARQFAILMMDLWARDERAPKRFKPFNSFESERAYYAQVADMSPPHGRSNLLLTAMGFKHRNAIQRYRDLLSLSDELWRLADDHNCPEGVLRELLRLPYEAALSQFFMWARTQGENVTSGDISGDKNISQMPAPVRPALLTDPACYRGNRLFTKPKEQEIRQKLKELASLRDGVAQSSSVTKQRIREMATEIRRLLDVIERSLGEG